jgi:hypothetical protein
MGAISNDDKMMELWLIEKTSNHRMRLGAPFPQDLPNQSQINNWRMHGMLDRQ